MTGSRVNAAETCRAYDARVGYRLIINNCQLFKFFLDIIVLKIVFELQFESKKVIDSSKRYNGSIKMGFCFLIFR